MKPIHILLKALLEQYQEYHKREDQMDERLFLCIYIKFQFQGEDEERVRLVQYIENNPPSTKDKTSHYDPFRPKHQAYWPASDYQPRINYLKLHVKKSKKIMLDLLKELLKQYSIYSVMYEIPYLCSIIGGIHINLIFTLKEHDDLINFIEYYRPVKRGMIGYDSRIIGKTNNAFWTAHLVVGQSPNRLNINYQSRINFLKQHIKRLQK